MDFHIFAFAVLLCHYFLIPPFSVACHSVFPYPHSLILQTEEVGDCPYATVIILKPFSLPAAKAVPLKLP